MILYTITVGKITAVQAPCYIYRHQNYKHNRNFIPKTFANLIKPKMWPLCMARNGGPSADVRIHSWPGPTVDVRIHSRPGSTVGPEQERWTGIGFGFTCKNPPALGKHLCCCPSPSGRMQLDNTRGCGHLWQPMRLIFHERWLSLQPLDANHRTSGTAP